MPESPEARLAEQRRLVHEINLRLKRQGLWPTKKDRNGFVAKVEGSEGGWTVDATPGNSRIYLWEDLPNGFGSWDTQDSTSGGIFGVTLRNVMGLPLTDGQASRLANTIKMLRGTKREKAELLDSIVRDNGFDERDCEERHTAMRE